MGEICFSQQEFKTYLFILAILGVYIFYIMYMAQKETLSNINLSNKTDAKELEQTVKKLKNQLYDSQLAEQRCQTDLLTSLNTLKQFRSTKSSTTTPGPRWKKGVSFSSGNIPDLNSPEWQVGSKKVLNKIYNPIVSPDRIYPGGRLNVPSYNDYQMIGYVYKGDERYPLFGRYKVPGRTEKWEYYVIDETRNRLKIPFKSHNDNELYDNDTISIVTLGDGYKVKLYDFEQFRYDPNTL